MSSQGSGPRLRAVTYNIHGAVGTDGALDVERVLEVIGAMEPDVLALQEVDAGFRRGPPDLLERLAEGAGLRALFGPTLHRGAGSYGNALLTRYPVRWDERHAIGGLELRGAIEAVLEVRGHELHVIATHLALRRKIRRRQAERLAGLVDAQRGRVDGAVVMGDVNDWALLSRQMRPLDEALGRAPRRRSFPSRAPVFALDRIWCGGGARRHRVGVWRAPPARRASDHLPVWAEVGL